MSELESLGLETPKLNELNDSYEVGNLVDNLKQMLYVEYKSMPVFTDWDLEPDFVWMRALDEYFQKLRALFTCVFRWNKSYNQIL